MATQRIRRFDPIQVAKVMGVLYGIMGLLVSPIFLIISLAAPQEAGFDFGLGFAVLIPLLYACMGAVFTAIAAALYNLVAGWVGGIEIDLE